MLVSGGFTFFTDRLKQRLGLDYTYANVLGVENGKLTGSVDSEIIDAKKNAKINSIENAEFLLGDAGEVFEKLVSGGEKYSTVFVDPPRKGLDQKFIDTLLRLEPKKVVYVSCDPETLARDIKLLSEKYIINAVQPVDMFPMTFHVETVACLRLKE